jgi:large subunit ribosomal protein L7/L12
MSEEVLNTEETTPEVVETPAEVVAETPAPVVEEASAPVGEDVVVPAEFAAIVDAVEKMTVLQLNDLVKLLEKKWGVSAAAVAVAGPAAAAAEEKTDFTVVLTSDGGAKIAVMKVVKEVLGLGLKEAKDMVEAIPATVKEGMKKEDAEALKKQIEEAGGKVELK